MIFLFTLIVELYSFAAYSQISDASFFPSMKSINPGVAHMRTSGFVALDLSKKNVDKNQDVTTGGIVGGIKTKVDLKKGTVFRAGKGKGITFEALLDQEKGEKTESINSTTHGYRKISSEASSAYYGGILDLKYFGVSYSGAKYDYGYKFRVGTAPDLTARDIDYNLNYTTIKVGSAIKIMAVRVGAYVLSQKSSGNYTYTFYDPTTGNKGTTEKFPVTTSAKGYGVALGMTGNSMRFETSLEKMYANKLNISDDYPQDVSTPPPSSRLSVVGEARLRLFAIGVRARQIKGNYTDLEDLISSNLLYEGLGADDTRLETSFNFSFGTQKGFTYSAFYTQSEVTSKEKSPVFDNGSKFKVVTKSKAIGVNLSYIY
jgi:hypothetical protein